MRWIDRRRKESSSANRSFAIRNPIVNAQNKRDRWKPVLREGKGKVGPVITDNGNVIIDSNFGLIRKPTELELKLKSIPGVVETGLFTKLANIVYIGKPDSTEKIERKR